VTVKHMYVWSMSIRAVCRKKMAMTLIMTTKEWQKVRVLHALIMFNPLHYNLTQ